MKFFKFLNDHFWSIIFYISITACFLYWFNLIQLTDVEKAYYSLSALVALATRDILERFPK